MDATIIIAFVTAVPLTITALAAFQSARKNRTAIDEISTEVRSTNGLSTGAGVVAITQAVQRVEAQLTLLQERQISSERHVRERLHEITTQLAAASGLAKVAVEQAIEARAKAEESARQTAAFQQDARTVLGEVVDD